ncbi:MAG: hypothetical protein QF491_07985, partial [Alphaproteobacteria bacterium]|nr:hypothetical protein [Alphaproteobacteria bacterium]
RRPDDLPGLGGLSGGPMLDGRGRVVGVMVAASKRRGRVMTTAQSSMRELLAQIPDGFGDDAATAGDIRGGSFTERGDSLRQNLTVAKVLCRVGQPRRRPRRS